MPVILESSQYIGQNVGARKKLIEPTYWEAVMSQSKELPANLARLALRSKEFKFRVLDGIGVAEKVWSETNISSSRNGNGQVASVHSQSTTKREIWVRLSDGKERNISLPDNTNFAVREGHRLSLINISSKQLSQTHSYYLGIVNHDTDKWVFLDRQILIEKLSGIGSWISQQSANQIALVTLGIGLIPIAIYSNARYKTYVKPIEQKIEEIAAWCFKG